MLVAIKNNPKQFSHIEADLYSRRRDGRNVFALSLSACKVEQREGWRSVQTELFQPEQARYFIHECGRRTAKQEAAAVAEANRQLEQLLAEFAAEFGLELDTDNPDQPQQFTTAKNYG